MQPGRVSGPLALHLAPPSQRLHAGHHCPCANPISLQVWGCGSQAASALGGPLKPVLTPGPRVGATEREGGVKGWCLRVPSGVRTVLFLRTCFKMALLFSRAGAAGAQTPRRPCSSQFSALRRRRRGPVVVRPRALPHSGFPGRPGVSLGGGRAPLPAGRPTWRRILKAAPYKRGRCREGRSRARSGVGGSGSGASWVRAGVGWPESVSRRRCPNLPGRPALCPSASGPGPVPGAGSDARSSRRLRAQGGGGGELPPLTESGTPASGIPRLSLPTPSPAFPPPSSGHPSQEEPTWW